MDQVKHSRDIPAGLALLLLVAVVGAVYQKELFPEGFPAPGPWMALAARFPGFVLLSGGALLINLATIACGGPSLLSDRFHGRKLAALTGASRYQGWSPLLPIAAILGGGSAYFLLGCRWFYEVTAALPLGGISLSREICRWILRANLTLGAALLSAIVSKVVVDIGRWRLWLKGLPKFPTAKNSVVLGSLEEESETDSPRWCIVGLQALFGNVLITGSIGSGKTSATVLTYFDQILYNFDPKPSVLMIDPKGSFTRQALNLIEARGLKDRVLHMTLDGSVTFNPIYRPDALKSAVYRDIAKMIQSAAINFMGKSGDSSFWDTEGNTLIVNCLVHCIATKSYYTLIDLFETASRASDGAVISELEEVLESKEWTVEERFNLSRALVYFQKFAALEDRLKSSILTTATSFLNLFQEYQAARIFCPSQSQITLCSMDEVIDQGKFLLFDIKNQGLARAMGTFVKLHFEQGVLNRIGDSERTRRPALLLIDEYQDVATSGHGEGIGDESYFAKARESRAISIVASQSITSIENRLGRSKATDELIQSFRTRIFCHSNDLATIRHFQELIGQEDRAQTSRSYSEYSNRPNRNLLFGGFESSDANISESMSTSERKEYLVTAHDFSRLNNFEAFAEVFDGVSTEFHKLCLKPQFLKSKRISHRKLLKQMKRLALPAAALLLCLKPAFAFPNVCTVVKSSSFRTCLGFTVGSCMCGFPVPRPCALFSYYVPQVFVEADPNPKASYFSDFPGAAAQLAALGPLPIPFGAEADEGTSSFQAHVLGVPFTSLAFSKLPCGGAPEDQACFQGMSEHFGAHWNTGSGDLLQPGFLAWGLSPKACLLKGAATSATGEGGVLVRAGPSCSYPVVLPVFPPSMHSACNGWGTFFPRYGTYLGPSQTTASLMIASRIRSLSSEVLRSTSSDLDEIWQMLSPQSSGCFREGQNIGFLENIKNVREIGRLTSAKLKGHLYVIWKRVGCCRDLAAVPAAYAALEAMQASCAGMGGL